ncbi:hypothetical protein K470DRAFT_275888 [Piedraia hortae CBS 480.64]|uniref:BZIP domain-containing protein n=1 Tax=Piedraia hortae CBS 480.64 TaxID=1314780 RepID=A0A6A7C437_9PEZI|nr:hypothetical protein K470DRAFT_275888 [Piedraia hortae CBS 480.64]
MHFQIFATLKATILLILHKIWRSPVFRHTLGGKQSSPINNPITEWRSSTEGSRAGFVASLDYPIPPPSSTHDSTTTQRPSPILDHTALITYEFFQPTDNAALNINDLFSTIIPILQVLAIAIFVADVLTKCFGLKPRAKKPSKKSFESQRTEKRLKPKHHGNHSLESRVYALSRRNAKLALLLKQERQRNVALRAEFSHLSPKWKKAAARMNEHSALRDRKRDDLFRMVDRFQQVVGKLREALGEVVDEENEEDGKVVREEKKEVQEGDGYTKSDEGEGKD